MALYYYTTTMENSAVYHNNQECEEGLKIEAQHRVDTNTIPSGRRLCEVC